MSYNLAVPRRVTARLGPFVLAVAASGCWGGSVDVVSALRVAEVTSGWLDVGDDGSGRNKLVPTISFRLQNTSTDQVRTLQLNGVFRRCLPDDQGQPATQSDVSPADPEAGTCDAEDQVWGSSYIRAVGRDWLAPGSATGQFTLQSKLGYTGQQERLEMLQHRDFVDVKVELFVRHGADQWVRLGELPIDRQLLTQ